MRNLGDDIGRLEIEGRVGKGRRQLLAQLANVVGRRRVTFRQLHLDHPIIGADGRTVAEGKIVGTRRQPDIVDDEAALVLGDDLPDLVLDRLEDAFGGFDTRPGRRPDMELDQTAVDERKEVAPDQHEHCCSQRQHDDGDDRHDDAPIE